MDTFAAGIISLIMGFMFFSVIWYVLTLVARWRVFSKAGIAGWKSLVPIYSDYCTFKISWNTMYFWIVLAAGILSGWLGNMMEGQESVPFMVSFLASTVGLAITVINIIMNIKLAQRFGHTALFGLGLMFLSPLFTMMLGLGESEYLGNPEEGLPPRRIFYV